MKKILITAGPTWVPIDSVRVISNISSGETGLLLANEAKKYGYDVTLLLGPVGSVELTRKIKLIRYHYFKELKRVLGGTLRSKEFDIIIHSAAISDYEPLEEQKKKIPSNLKNLTITLKNTPKLIPLIKKFSPRSFFVIFKLENKVNDYYIEKARRLMFGYCADLVVLNSTYPYRARIIGRHGDSALIRTKKCLSQSLFTYIIKKGGLK